MYIIKKALTIFGPQKRKKKRSIATIKLIKINAKIEAAVKKEWELAIGIKYIGL